jgi:RNA polymerase sigma-70 factor, ECF subfamily
MQPPADVLSATFVSMDDLLEREFEARLAECSGLAFRVAFAVLRHRQDAEDVAQDAFVRAHQRFRQLRDRDRFRAWLVRMTWRMALDHRRSARRRVTRDLALVREATLSPTMSTEADARAAALWEAIDALPEKLRITLVLASIEGHEIHRVAALLGLPDGTVKSRLFLARQRLKEHLQCPPTIDLDR